MPCDFQTFAVDLYEERKANGDEATIRTCISRLYYSIYHAVLRWLQTNNADLLAKFKCGSHERIQFSLQAIARETKKIQFNELALKLHNLHARRCTADYKLDQKQVSQHVELMVKDVARAHFIFNELVAFMQNKP